MGWLAEYQNKAARQLKKKNIGEGARVKEGGQASDRKCLFCYFFCFVGLLVCWWGDVHFLQPGRKNDFLRFGEGTGLKEETPQKKIALVLFLAARRKDHQPFRHPLGPPLLVHLGRSVWVVWVCRCFGLVVFERELHEHSPND